MREVGIPEAQPQESRRPGGLRTAITVIPGQLRLARWLWMPVMLFGISRLVIVLVAYAAVIMLPENPATPPYHLRPAENNVVLDVLGSRWDAGFYVSIVEEGYIASGVPLPNIPFFPLLPLAMYALLPVTGDAVLSGILAANLALLLAAIVFYRLVAMSWGERVADRAVWYLLIFPAALFGSAIYSESLFLLASIAALYFARRGKWWLSGLFAIAATLTRFVGLIVAPMLLLEWLLQQRSEKPPGKTALLAPLLAPLGTLAFVVYQYFRFGDALAFMHASANWGRVPRAAADTIAALLARPEQGWPAAILAGQINLNDWFDLLVVAFFMALALVLMYQHRWSEGMFIWLGALIPLSSGLLMSQRRYMWVLFPAYILLAQWGHRPWLDRLITALFLTGLALFTALFARGYWVA